MNNRTPSTQLIVHTYDHTRILYDIKANGYQLHVLSNVYVTFCIHVFSININIKLGILN